MKILLSGGGTGRKAEREEPAPDAGTAAAHNWEGGPIFPTIPMIFYMKLLPEEFAEPADQTASFAVVAAVSAQLGDAAVFRHHSRHHHGIHCQILLFFIC